jgi:hypothetical protein
MARIINVSIEDRGDGSVYVWSDDLPGLILSGKLRTRILAGILPAARAILEHKGEDASDLQINATFITAAQPGAQP